MEPLEVSPTKRSLLLVVVCGFGVTLPEVEIVARAGQQNARDKPHAIRISRARTNDLANEWSAEQNAMKVPAPMKESAVMPA
jgi:hypothetical protein